MLVKYLNLKYSLALLLCLGVLQYNCKDHHLSKRATVSLLTCDEGSEIYSLFGHSALRIIDDSNSIDQIYNWGMFEFSENEFDFGYQFAKGRLVYYMAIQSFENFIYEYFYFKRGVREQILLLNQNQKQLLYEELQLNYLPENRKYNYDFFYDNCSSRIRDILKKVLDNDLIFTNHKDADQFTFRQIIDVNLKSQPWLDLGIDLVLGSKIDVRTSNKHLMFLPKYLEEILDSSLIKQEDGSKKPLVLEKLTLLASHQTSKQELTGTELYFWFILFITLILIVFRVNYATMSWIGFLLFTIGLLGIVLIFMWIGTDHNGTKINYNLIWANPVHLITLFSLFAPKFMKQLKIYYLIMTIILFSVVLFWIILPQEFHPSIKPLILCLTLIHFYLFNKSKKLRIEAHGVKTVL